MIKSNLFAVWKKTEQGLGRRLTYADVSEATGISVPTLSRWMTGKVKRFGGKTVGALTKYFGCSVADLLVEAPEGEDG
ncbi:MAG TPA: helix-turn-helix transcriptional regulator [Anaerolineae bacterium]|nr:helix-turn-helix transcriptional regulator [Anaerolineae bacterium]